MRKMLVFAFLMLANCAHAKPITVAVIDSGIYENLLTKNYDVGLCKMGHKDFTGEGINDTHGHGSNVSGLIHKSAQGVEYCQVILKYYHSKVKDPKCFDREWDKIMAARKKLSRFERFIDEMMIPDKELRQIATDRCMGEANKQAMIDAINYAIAIKVDVINLSAGGIEPIADEKKAIIKALNKGIVIVAAAGNLGKNLETKKFYPALYDKRIMVVGNGEDATHRSPASNYGKRITVWERGERQCAYGMCMSGTSQATAIATGKLVRSLYVQGR